jgi:hypothetical protein
MSLIASIELLIDVTSTVSIVVYRALTKETTHSIFIIDIAYTHSCDLSGCISLYLHSHSLFALVRDVLSETSKGTVILVTRYNPQLATSFG